MRRPVPPQQVIDLFLDMYRRGAFPMAEFARAPRANARGEISFAKAVHWYQPDPRAILPLDDNGLHIPRTIARSIRKSPLRLTSDTAFERVIRACAQPEGRRGGAWLDESLIRCYTLLHERAHAHSIEAWLDDGSLVGGIYGLSIGAAFFAESMFTDFARGSGASSICLIALWHHLRTCGHELLDVQIANDHTRRFGIVEIPLADYLTRLHHATSLPDRWRPLPAPNGPEEVR